MGVGVQISSSGTIFYTLEVKIMSVYDGYIIGKSYLGSDGRIRIYLTSPDGVKHVKSYPRYLMEVHLDRYLTNEETVDHIDYNPQNNDISNLRIVNRSEHCSDDAKRLAEQEFICPYCGKKFILSGKRLHNRIVNQNRKGRENMTGPYCSKSCASKAVRFGKDLSMKHDAKRIYTTKKVDKLNLEYPYEN